MTVPPPNGPGPLDGVRVVELGVWVAGPAVGAILADWGGDVVKVEPPTGDPARSFARMIGSDLPVNPPFELDNRGKRSVVVDVSAPRGRDLVLRMLDDADVFVTNLRLAALERLGLDPATVRSSRPRLVYAVLTGFGLEGAERDRAAYDIGAFWARSGIAALLTPPDGPPPFQRGGMGDHISAATLAGAVAAALLVRERTGEGQVVATSLLRQGAYTAGFDLSVALRLGARIGFQSRSGMANPLVNAYRSGDDRWFWLVGLEADRHWPMLVRAVERSDLSTDPRFATAAARAKHSAELVAVLDDVFGRRPRHEWAAAFDREGVWWAPVQEIDELVDDAQAHAAGVFREVPDRQGTAMLVATPADFSATPAGPRGMPPALGEHTAEVLAELGLGADEVAVLRREGLIGP